MVRPLLRLLTFTLCCASAATFAQVELEVRPDPAHSNQSIELLFRVDAAPDDAPDFTPLSANFDIIKTRSQSTQFAVNGRVERSTTYVLEVMPKSSGTITIPAITFGRERSTARKLDIEQAPGSTQGASAELDFIVEASASTTRPYVQQQVIYTVRALFGAQVSSPRLSPVSASGDAVVKQLGDGRQVTETRGGRSYEGFEMRYAIFPQASGTLRIAPAVVTAELVATGRRSVFDPFAQSFSTRRVQSQGVDLEVRPVPAAFPAGATWLPAKRLRLHEEWEPDGSAAEVGMPLTRTVFLWADGLLAGQLPKLELAAPPDVKLYPDQAQTSDQDTAGGYTAVLQQKYAVIAAQPGNSRFAPVEVPWWNTDTDALEFARLPARDLSVAAAPGGAPAASSATPESAPVASPSPSQPVALQAPAASGGKAGRWRLIAAALAVAWGVTLLLWQRGRRAVATQPGPRAPEARLHSSATASDLASACRANDARAAHAALLHLARERGAGAAPRALVAPGDADLAEAIAALERQLYSADGNAPWHGAALLAAWQQADGKPARGASRTGALPPLYRLGAEAGPP